MIRTSGKFFSRNSIESSVEKLSATINSAAPLHESRTCLLYTSDAADERSSVDIGGRRIIKKKKKTVYGVSLIRKLLMEGEALVDLVIR